MKYHTPQLKISPIIAGTMNWGRWGRKFSLLQMKDLIHTCYENRITSFDHADIYGDYTTETEFGNAFSATGIQRDKVQFISKCGICHVSENKQHKIKHYNYSKEYVLECVENTLVNLKTDYLDVLLLHRPNPLMNPDVIAEAIEYLKSQGKIIDFGVSNFTPIQTDLIRQQTHVAYNQISFSATNWAPMTDGTIEHMQCYGIIPMAWNPLGCVFQRETDQSRRLTLVIEKLARKYGTDAASILFAWILKHPANIIPVAGTTSLERIVQLRKSTEINLETEDWFSIWTQSMGHDVP